MPGQEWDIFFSFAEGRNPDADFVEAEVKVLTELSAGGFFFEVGIGGGDDLHVDLFCGGASDRIEFLVLDDLQDLCLESGVHVSDFVEEDNALVGEGETSGFCGGSAGKGAFFVAE